MANSVVLNRLLGQIPDLHRLELSYNSIKCFRADSEYPQSLLDHRDLRSFSFNAMSMRPEASTEILEAVLPIWKHLRELRLERVLGLFQDKGTSAPTYNLDKLVLVDCSLHSPALEWLYGQTTRLEHLEVFGSVTSLEVCAARQHKHPLQYIALVDSTDAIHAHLLLKNARDIKLGSRGQAFAAFTAVCKDWSLYKTTLSSLDIVSARVRAREDLPPDSQFFTAFGKDFLIEWATSDFPNLKSIRLEGPVNSDRLVHEFRRMCEDRNVSFSSKPWR